MLRPRIIPCLLLENGDLIKTVNFKPSKYIGDPLNAVRIFNEKEVDELIVLDITATLETDLATKSALSGKTVSIDFGDETLVSAETDANGQVSVDYTPETVVWTGGVLSQ